MNHFRKINSTNLKRKTNNVYPFIFLGQNEWKNESGHGAFSENWTKNNNRH